MSVQKIQDDYLQDLVYFQDKYNTAVERGDEISTQKYQQMLDILVQSQSTTFQNKF
jgi:hypothetical protein